MRSISLCLGSGRRRRPQGAQPWMRVTTPRSLDVAHLRSALLATEDIDYVLGLWADRDRVHKVVIEVVGGHGFKHSHLAK